MDSNRVLLLGSALFSLLTGLLLFGLSIRAKDPRHFYATNIICWLLIALFPVFLIFSFFPDSTFSGKILGASMGGALGAFIFIWYYGTKKTRTAVEADNVVQENHELKKQLAAIKAQPPSGNVRQPLAFRECQAHQYKVKAVRGKAIGLLTGNITGINCADIWVSSENTNMEMARFAERSVSAVIRYHGAKKDEAGDVVEDVIADELRQVRGKKLTVQPGTVFNTGPGELRSSNNVKVIFHVASVRGEVGIGYRAVDDLEACITNALRKAEQFKVQGYSSIVFPLMGTGTARGGLPETAERLIRAALNYLEKNPDSILKTVYFLAWSDIELEACQKILDGLPDRLVRA